MKYFSVKWCISFYFSITRPASYKHSDRTHRCIEWNSAHRNLSWIGLCIRMFDWRWPWTMMQWMKCWEEMRAVSMPSVCLLLLKAISCFPAVWTCKCRPPYSRTLWSLFWVEAPRPFSSRFCESVFEHFPEPLLSHCFHSLFLSSPFCSLIFDLQQLSPLFLVTFNSKAIFILLPTQLSIILFLTLSFTWVVQLGHQAFYLKFIF